MRDTRERSRPLPAGTGPDERPSPLVAFGLPSLLSLPLAAVVWAIQRLGAGPWVAGALAAGVGGALGLWALRRLGRASTRPSWWLHWDVVGFVATAALAGLATVLAVETLLPSPGLFRTTRVVLPVALAGAAFAGSVGAALARHRGASPGRAVRDAARVWSEPAADWSFFVLGVILSLPLAALISPVAWDADSGRLLLDVSRARHEGPGFFIQTQQAFLPILIYTPVLAVAGAFGATAVAVASMQALVGVTGFLTRKLTGGVLAPIAAMLALLSLRPLVRQADVLPLYPLMLGLGYLAGWVGLRVIRAEGRARLGLAALTGLLLAATVESHDIGKLFVALPLFLLALEPTTRGLRGVALIYAALALFAIPRIVVNLADGGLANVLVNRTDWIVQSGYKRLINAEFWGHPVGDKATFFARLVRPYWAGPAGWFAAIPVGLGTIALAASRWRARLFALLAAGLLLAGLLRTNAPPHARYLSPLLPGLAIVAGIGIRHLATRARARPAVAAIVLALAAGAVTSYVSVVREAHRRQETILELQLDRITERIDDERAVTGVRPVRLMSVEPRLRLLSAAAFDEEEWVTYLTWPSDRSVVEALRGRGVGWVVVYTDRRLEVDYDATWVEPVYGERVRHATRIRRSPSFCRVAEQSGYVLYRLGPCPG